LVHQFPNLLKFPYFIERPLGVAVDRIRDRSTCAAQAAAAAPHLVTYKSFSSY
jgi:hypothetical protein